MLNRSVPPPNVCYLKSTVIEIQQCFEWRYDYQGRVNSRSDNTVRMRGLQEVTNAELLWEGGWWAGRVEDSCLRKPLAPNLIRQKSSKLLSNHINELTHDAMNIPPWLTLWHQQHQSSPKGHWTLVFSKWKWWECCLDPSVTSLVFFPYRAFACDFIWQTAWNSEFCIGFCDRVPAILPVSPLIEEWIQVLKIVINNELR